jgi:flagella basal body P-ring formation protein FlgA
MSRMRPTSRPFAAMLALAVGVLLAVAAGSAEAVTLRPHVVVHDETVRLRDVFDGVGSNKGETALFHAPDPGQSVVLNGNWLRQVARAYGLDWHPAPGLDQSRVERSSNRVGRKQILGALSEALKDRVGPSKQFEVAIDNPDLELHLPVSMPAAVTVKHLQFDDYGGRFSATLVAPDDRPGAVVVPVAGRIHELIQVPVLTRRVRPGELIDKDDVQMQLVRAEFVGQNVITSSQQIIGKSARRSLPGGKPLNSTDVREPQLVTRGSTVVMTYRTRNLMITAHGKARENGTAGDTVRVQNANSGKTVDAIVTGPDTVAVLPLTQSAEQCAKCR